MGKETVSKIIELKAWIVEQIKATPVGDFPRKISYHEGLEEPVYTITIDVAEQDFFVDKKGTKWIRDK